MDDKEKVVKLLNDAKKERNSENRILYFGKKLQDIPSEAHSLEEGEEEHLVVNLHGFDCVTFVETVIAFTLCDIHEKRTFEDFCQFLTLIRYREGILTDYTSRLHYFTWWAEDNEKKGILKDITIDDEPFTEEKNMEFNYMSSHPDYYKHLKNHPEFIPIIKNYEEKSNRKYRYIPKQNLSGDKNSSLNIIHDGDIIGMMSNLKGLDFCHVGFVFWKNEKLYLMHLSFIENKVMINEETLYDYEMNHPNHLGIKVFRLVDNEN